MDRPATAPGAAQAPDLRERGVGRDGEPRFSSRRLFMQLQAYSGCDRPGPLAEALKAGGIESALYLDVNDPRGVAVLAISEDPSLFAGALRRLLLAPPFASLAHRPELTMLGRTYATGREPDLEFALLEKPRLAALNPEWPWALWYPLRRKAEFNILTPEEQGKILYEHAQIGIAYGRADLAHDIRLACHGLDRNDNDFVIGLMGRELHPLSHIVQEMRKTQQTGRYMKSLGPFFVGRVAWQSPRPTGQISY